MKVLNIFLEVDTNIPTIEAQFTNNLFITLNLSSFGNRWNIKYFSFKNMIMYVITFRLKINVKQVLSEQILDNLMFLRNYSSLIYFYSTFNPKRRGGRGDFEHSKFLVRFITMDPNTRKYIFWSKPRFTFLLDLNLIFYIFMGQFFKNQYL